jgi:hypothetical protein
MATSFTNILSQEYIQSLLHLPEVLAAKENIDSKTSGSVYFNIPLTTELKEILNSAFGLDLNGISSIPMRWIKGDTHPHIDRGSNEFDNTYLVYLTNSDGNFVIGDEIYPITEGAGYIFPEGIYHETINTGSEARLLLGPMSEMGFAVGIAGIYGDGGTTIYIRQNGSNVQYSNDQSTWNTIFFPTSIQNTNTSLGMLKVVFTTSIVLTDINSYFLCYSSHIQIGSESLNADGTRPTITIDGVTNYPGLIQNGSSSSNGQNNIHIFNLVIGDSNGTTLVDSGGWVGQEYFGKGATDNYILNCTSAGVIPNSGGGIVGSFAAIDSGSSLTVIGCSTTGSIATGSGGIVGARAGEGGGTITCESCWSTGSIGTQGGGIIGNALSTNGSVIVITNCYTSGSIDFQGGGICGYGCDNGTISKCYTTGSIGSQAGGIVSTSTNTVVTNCYTTGNASGGGCIAGSGTVTVTNCYTTGTVTGGVGYIKYNSSTVPATCYSEDKNSGSGWNTTNANTVLQGVPISTVGTTWVATVLNDPYELYNMGYTPYSLTIIDTTSSPSLVQIFSESLTAGSTSSEAIMADASGNIFVILEKSGGDSGSYGTITISSQTGVLTTTSSTVPGIYTITIRSIGSYNITTFTLNVTVQTSQGEVTCCDRPLQLNNIDYRRRNEILGGNILIGSTVVRRQPMSYSDMIRIKMAYSAKQ